MTELLPEDTADPGWMLDEELVDTLASERRKNLRNYQKRLERIRAATPPDKRLPGCDYCGQRPLPGRRVCHAHSDIA